MEIESKFYPDDFISGSTWMVAQEMEKELAALKAKLDIAYKAFDQQETIKQSIACDRDNFKAENERLRKEKDDVMLVAVTTRKENEQLQADKAELLEALKDLNSLVTYDHPAPNAVYKAERLISKHEAK